ncbi:hypothetical protein EGY16_21430 [Burkholderia pseudomallei]|uniref:Uncharacterized protein n=2 Tax=Burkholderia pseudomallei TaxID=28450 RepID=A0AAX0U6E6_BURPE|nr:hypothetical protein BURPS1106A_0407 [Burkholderia pseudomallei 1106a]AFR14283.1 hypothetical protein BPC006_I0393 [Burkholderia pseudomallei BPC006]AUL56771.1 hypothetical protein BHT10_13420 [Burkholderia pseudomallei]EES26781.1 hypothetical protein BURPS1106B_A3690 [Burkholderia pseudomallei 1106b]PNX05050.1 hypothetical protein CF649_07875 [Burkholderia sp. 136(2017)]PNX16288.1 hypothetical protein CF650_09320 [Burkholderia sp. 129]PNX31842.1 hypothetical protein CF647_07775 [Burkholde
MALRHAMRRDPARRRRGRIHAKRHHALRVAYRISHIARGGKGEKIETGKAAAAVAAARAAPHGPLRPSVLPP